MYIYIYIPIHPSKNSPIKNLRGSICDGKMKFLIVLKQYKDKSLGVAERKSLDSYLANWV